jgi:tetratricopeptide (TPR) repeat protein
VRLSAALIVKDEAQHLRRCLASLEGIVDEIVVVDTGSSDESVAVAESFGARVLHRPWDGDFSAPRNLGLEHVTGDWVLYIDADEHLVPTTRAHVEAELADPEGRHVAMRVRLRTHHGYTPLREYRLWRHRPDVRFHGVIHETHVRALRAVAEREGLLIGDADLQLEHEGYEGDLTHKHHRNLPLLLQQLEDDPQRVYLWGELGRTRRELGDLDGALAAWEAGVAAARRRPQRIGVDCVAHFDLILHRARAGEPDAALVADADALFPGNPLVLWAGTVDAIARQDHAEVVRRLDALLAMGPEDLARDSLALKERILGDWGHHARGMARFHLGDHTGAAADFARAEALAPGIEEYAVKRRLAEARAAARSSAPRSPAER